MGTIRATAENVSKMELAIKEAQTETAGEGAKETVEAGTEEAPGREPPVEEKLQVGQNLYQLYLIL